MRLYFPHCFQLPSFNILLFAHTFLSWLLLPDALKKLEIYIQIIYYLTCIKICAQY